MNMKGKNLSSHVQELEAEKNELAVALAASEQGLDIAIAERHKTTAEPEEMRQAAGWPMLDGLERENKELQRCV